MAGLDVSTSPALGRVTGSVGRSSLAWAGVSFVAFIAVFVVLIWPVSQLEQATGLAHPLTLGVWAFAWVLGSGQAALVAARVVFGARPPVRHTAWLLLLTGAVLSAAQVVVLADWTIARFGYNDAEFVGATSVLFGAIGAVAVAGFGVMVAPRDASGSPRIAVGIGVTMAVLIIGSNIPGLLDGLSADSGALAIVTGAAGLYVAFVAYLAATIKHS